MDFIIPLPDGGVSSPQGFQAGTAAAGVKPGSSRPDIALVTAESACSAAGIFTTNQVAAAPVLLDKETLAGHAHEIRAVVANAGNANACTGAQGMEDARQMQTLTAAALACRPAQVLVLSTGVIGVPLPMDRIATGIKTAAEKLTDDGGAAAARAIMTTDTRPKQAAVQVRLPGGMVTLGGMAKGSGMIHPNMATMLAVLTTDAALPPPQLQKLLRQAADQSFNRISVDGDTSTNDTVLLLANGASGISPETAEDEVAFAAGLDRLCRELARMIVLDGEGASKFVIIEVRGTADSAGAHQVANTIATSPLVKTALAGSDANWGRFLMAAGRAGVPFEQARVDLWVGSPGGTPLQLVRGGTPTGYLEADAAAIFAGGEIVVQLTLGPGPGTATVWTCDLTHEYVSINADYRT